jgi:radical SAM family uncharacterized protein/radical SAM-linked protein
MNPRLLLDVEKPGRYIGLEPGSIRKDNPEIRFVLAFPDVYDVGMSHLGLKILYAVLNDMEGVAAERAFAPWPDMAALLESNGEALRTLESGTPLGDADILGFTLQYELSYTTILAMLEQARIPTMASERSADHPLILGGGPCAFNPEPLADFFDAFLLGDGEEAVTTICQVVRQWKKSGEPRQRLLEQLAAIKGVYVPSHFNVSHDKDGHIIAINPLMPGHERVTRAFVEDLDQAPFPTSPVVPLLKTIHDRVSLEITRGCTRGCRFCQAGYLYRPVRERSPDTILDLAAATLSATGYDDISLLSLSTGDYSCIAPLLKELMQRYAESRIAVSLPSLRVGTLTGELVEEIRRVRKTGFTLAPEAGSERLRQAINKGITEEDLLANAHEAFSNGWRIIKLYFMMGLPGETDDDLRAIASLAARTKAEGKKAGRGGEVNVSVSTFVPKAHTPFQWEPQISLEETSRRHAILRQELKRHRLNLKWHDPGLSWLEGVFARGDRRLGAVLRAARARGCSFDGWGERFDLQKWQAAFDDAGIDPNFYHRRRHIDEILPWSHLDCGVDPRFLVGELERSRTGAPTGDCRDGSCNACGICDFRSLKMRLTDQLPSPRPDSSQPGPEGVRTIRLRHEKRGPLALLSHLELISIFSRAVSRAAVPIRFSCGFHPHPRFSFATALSVGIESVAEYFDMDIEPSMSAQEVMAALNRVLPEGLRILEAREIPPKAPSLTATIQAVRYRITLPDFLASGLQECLDRFLALEDFPLVRERKKGAQHLDLRQELMEAEVRGPCLSLLVHRGKPREFAAAITGLSSKELALVPVEKLEVIFGEAVQPLHNQPETIS